MTRYGGEPMGVFRRAVHLGSITGVSDDPRDLAARVGDLAAAAEDAGFDAILVPDHMAQGAIGGGPLNPIFEAYTLLAFLATRTSTVRLGALVSPVTFHHPAHLAKQITSLDVISGGRAIAGLGAAWDEAESVASGIPFPAVGERMDRLDETLTICRKMFDEERPTFAGAYWRIEQPHNVPAPSAASRSSSAVVESGEHWHSSPPTPTLATSWASLPTSAASSRCSTVTSTRPIVIAVPCRGRRPSRAAVAPPTNTVPSRRI
jgi:hypothetical protein